MTDSELLREYISLNSEESFAALVRRYAGLVYSAALRQTGNAHDAEEVAQVVFFILSRKAGSLRRDTILPGWLLTTTRFVALNARRRQLHRLQLQEAAANIYRTETDAAWERIAPILDEVLVDLGEKDRNAVILRFFEGKSFKEIGKALDTTDDNAQKRVSRALNKLRASLLKRGLVLSSTLIAGAITTKAVQAAPAHLIAPAMIKAILAGQPAGSIIESAKATLEDWQAARVRKIVRRTAAAGFAIAIIWLVTHLFVTGMTKPGNPASVAAQAVAPTAAIPVPLAIPPPITLPVNSGNMRLRVVESESQVPISNARLTQIWYAGLQEYKTNLLTTDDRGECLLPIDRSLDFEDWSWWVEIVKAGYASKFINWSSARGDSLQAVPIEYEVKLARAVEIGGIVLNEKQEPISGVRVAITDPALRSPVEFSKKREGLALAHAEFTDDQGRWHCAHLPLRFETATFHLFHPDYATAGFGSTKAGSTTNLGAEYITEDDLRAKTAIMKIQRGLIVSGVVVDDQGGPIPGAIVTRNRNWFDPDERRTTGTDGRFSFGDVIGQDLIITVQAEGFLATDINVHDVGANNELRFVLAPAACLRGRVVDESGNPVHAIVKATGAEFENNRFYWSAITDEEGRFVWRSVSPGQGVYAIHAPGFQSKTRVDLVADGIERSITVHKSSGSQKMHFMGNVVNAETSQPVESFEVLMAMTVRQQLGSGQTTTIGLAPELQTTGEAGAFSFPVSPLATAVSYALEIRADGYLPAKMTVAGPLNNDSRLDFKLRPVAPLSGLISLPDGSPAVGATAILCTDKEDAYMKLPAQLDLVLSSANRAETDAEGRFAIQPKTGMRAVFISHPAGCAEVPLQRLGEAGAIVLQPWGRVSGLLKIGSQLASNESIYLGNLIRSSNPHPALQLHREAKTDAEGRFLIEGVPPGEYQISHLLSSVNGRHGRMPLTQGVPIQLNAGETVEVTLGGMGRKVVGKIQLVDSARQIDWRHDLQMLTAKVPAFPTTGQSGQFPARQYVLEFETDGSFKIDDVLPGTYELNIQFSDPKLLNDPVHANVFARLQQEFVLPEATNGNPNENFDLGILECRPNQP